MELTVVESKPPPPGRRLPPWLKRPLPFGSFGATRGIIARSGIATVCEDARCPNLSECWSKGTATFMIMGHDCTRRCHFCAVVTAKPDPLELDEPRRLAIATAEMSLNHVVITAVARDDLPDEGAGHFAECVRQLHERAPDTTVEVLPADFHARRECIAELVAAGPDIYNHNIETVERLTPVVRPQAKYKRSMRVLEIIKELSPDMPTKSGIMVGLGESFDELIATFRDLQAVGCDILTVGQYLQPTRTDHANVEKFYTPAEFDALADAARDAGFKHVASGPFVRSSYNAAEVFAALRDRSTSRGLQPARTHG
ncbi:MAG: lipoyl synthase [Planctomycetes bacterium]|nr:lipoyl synthase [Planctomycetota bacterium]